MTELNSEVKEEAKESDKEFNFRMQAAKYEKQIAQMEQDNSEMRRSFEEKQRQVSMEEDEEDSDPYVDNKKLNKRLERFSEQSKQSNQKDTQRAIDEALKRERQDSWLKNNSDFNDVMSHVQKFANADPELAETILEMPDTFERKKLVYKNIKALGLHKPAEEKPQIQDVINKNQRNMYYQPSGIGNAPYESSSDFSPTGQKDAYQKMQDLKNRLRIG